MQDGPVVLSEHLERLQSGLAVLAKHDRVAVVQALERWAAGMVQAVTKNGSTVGVVTRKRVAVCCLLSKTRSLLLHLQLPDAQDSHMHMLLHFHLPAAVQVEVLFLGAMQHLLDERILLDPPSTQKLQERAFHFVIDIDHFVAAPELVRQREQLVAMCHNILGSLSRMRLLQLVQSFQEHLQRVRNQDAPQRPAAVALCAGMGKVQLTLASNRDLDAATAALPRLSPLQPLIIELTKKGAVQNALCDALASILRDTVDNGVWRIALRVDTAPVVAASWRVWHQSACQDCCFIHNRRVQHCARAMHGR